MASLKSRDAYLTFPRVQTSVYLPEGARGASARRFVSPPPWANATTGTNASASTSTMSHVTRRFGGGCTACAAGYQILSCPVAQGGAKRAHGLAEDPGAGGDGHRAGGARLPHDGTWG